MDAYMTRCQECGGGLHSLAELEQHRNSAACSITQLTTTLVRINPTGNEVVARMHSEALRAQDYAEARIILTDGDAKLATDDLVILRRLKKGMEEKRKEYTDPLNAHIKAINDTFKVFMGPILAADATTTEKILDYRHEQERKVAEITEINRLRLEAAQKEAALSGTGEISESVVILESPELPGKTVVTDNGSASTAKIPKFEVEDITLVPAEFLVVDMVALGKQVRAGRRNIPGVRIWVEDSLRVRGK